MQVVLKNWRLAIIFLLLVINFLIWSAIVRKEKVGELTVAFLDVGQGDAIFIEAPNGNQILIDGGPNQAVLRGLGQLMSLSDRTIDLVIATHPDADHVGGLPAVFARYQINGFLAADLNPSTATYQALLDAARAEARVVLAARGQRINLGAGAVLDILAPAQPAPIRDTNESSIVALLRYGDQSFLLLGDAPIKVEKNLLNLYRQQLAAGVLKLGHHGSKTSSAPEFLQTVAPDYAVISVGAKNRYGHPSPEVLQTLAAQKIKILRTDESGVLIFRTDGTEMSSRF